VTTTLADGQKGTVLDLPKNAYAVSPSLCIDSMYPQARTMIKDVSAVNGVHVYVSYNSNGQWAAPIVNASVPGTGPVWSVSPPIVIQSSGLTSAVPAQFLLVGGSTGETEVYDFYVDPRMI